MIIANGTIQYKQSVAKEEFDSRGFPTKETDQWSDPLPCQIVPVEYDATAMSQTGTPYKDVKYKVLIEQRHYHPSEEVRLVNAFFKEAGIYRVISREYLQAVRQHQLLCR